MNDDRTLARPTMFTEARFHLRFGHCATLCLLLGMGCSSSDDTDNPTGGDSGQFDDSAPETSDTQDTSTHESGDTDASTNDSGTTDTASADSGVPDMPELTGPCGPWNWLTTPDVAKSWEGGSKWTSGTTDEETLFRLDILGAEKEPIQQTLWFSCDAGEVALARSAEQYGPFSTETHYDPPVVFWNTDTETGSTWTTSWTATETDLESGGDPVVTEGSASFTVEDGGSVDGPYGPMPTWVQEFTTGAVLPGPSYRWVHDGLGIVKTNSDHVTSFGGL